jgi:peptidoglycan/LPS O-acetylase OafA/YrhL
VNDVGGCEATAPECVARVVRIAPARWVAVVLALLVGVLGVYDGQPFWVDGVNVPVAIAGVVLFTAPPVLAASAVGVWLGRRGRGRALRFVLLLGQASWAAIVAGAVYGVGEITKSQGWGLAVLTYAVALGLLAGAWWAEDRLATNPRQNARTAGMASCETTARRTGGHSGGS